ncbi:hypothetical protein CI109_101145 [Kwoniella shandongensis]|uniref:Uncharacterized protein n=1 Tax=Kwoniella shandongensis TaxID=1734106 RepID=A0A5M6C4W9_9TREE|nr:uncharacterized protein CI109_001614 [Kwoniella shandongensis]KAA5530207.1 hypothetical protein CI109_001614 [Kwoniella shandongensis]
MIKASRLGWRREGIGTSATGTYTSTGMGEECEAGPSRIPMGSERKKEDGDERRHLRHVDCGACQRERQQQRRRRNASSSSSMHGESTSRSKTSLAFFPLASIISPFLLPFLPVVSAVPAPAPTSNRPSLPSSSLDTSPSPTTLVPTNVVRLDNRGVHYLTSVVTPSVLPTAVTEVDETRLPYLLTQHPDGKWRKAEGGWFLYGRRIASPTTNPVLADTNENGTDSTSIATSTPTYAVKETLPNGWGSSSNRTSFYKVPLIAVASVLMALAIVAFLIFIVIRRRKRHRKAKRAKERLRRKALAAAGIREDDLNGSVADALFKEKLAELEQQHSSKKRKSGQSGIAKTKVRGWNAKLRKRKGKKTQGEEQEQGATIAVIEEEQDDGDKEVGGVLSASPVPLTPSDEEGGSSSTQSPEINGAAHVSSASTPSVEQAQPSSNVDHPSATLNAISATHPIGSTSYFPPAYRPASVRSLAGGQSPNAAASSAGPSRPAIHMASVGDNNEEPDHILSGAEKTQAPGYYPAPATEDGEIALAIASRRDGKARVVDPPEDDGEEDREARARTAHVATDDKRILEQLRLGASAPPATRTDEGDRPDGAELGHASAPVVQVDEQGFETLDVDPSGDTPRHTPSLGDAAFPPPPPKLANRHSGLPIDIPSSPVNHSIIDEAHLLPSAPPILGDVPAPSAPPGLDEEEETEIPNGHMASAPPLELDQENGMEAADEGEQTSAERLDHPSPLEEHSEQNHDSLEAEGDDDGAADHEDRRDSEMSLGLGIGPSLTTANGNGNGVLYLPRYEP